MDQGTTGSTVLVISVTDPASPVLIGKATVDFPQHFPQEGWVEHDASEIWASMQEACKKSLKVAAGNDPNFDSSRISAIGITNQRETTVAFNRVSGNPLARAIVWQCRRTTATCEARRKRGLEAEIRKKTGLVLDPYFSASKMEWLLDHNKDVAAAAQSGNLAFGTIDTYLLHRLTGGATFATEPSNASRTMLLNINTGKWDESLLKEFKIPSVDCLPQVRDSAGTFGHTKGLGFLPDGIPISGILGDQQAALAGQACFKPGQAKCTYGTGAFLLLNTGNHPKSSTAGMLTTVAWSLEGKLTYALEGSAFIAGAAMQFLRDQLKFIPSAAASEALAQNASAAPSVYFVPALAGLGAPWWDAKARGAFFGLTRGTTTAQLARAALESIAFQVTDLLSAMAKDLGMPIDSLRVDGGASANNLLMQMQADFTGARVDRPRNIETTAFGAAMFAALGCGIYHDISQLEKARASDRVFEPHKTAANDKQIEGWHRAVHATQVFAGTK
jgi:glycerol kinase